ncbi:MAG: hypothetical protein ACRCXZ_01020, partial [Patescibacteria group bacterium]
FSFIKKWPFLQTISQLLLIPIMIGLYTENSVNGSGDADFASPRALIFTILFIIINYAISLINSLRETRYDKFDIVNSVVSNLLLISFVPLYLNSNQSKGFVLLIFGFIFFMLAFLLKLKFKNNRFIYLQLFSYISTLIAATILIVSNISLLIPILVIEVIGSSLLFFYLFEDKRIAHASSFLHIIPSAFALESLVAIMDNNNKHSIIVNLLFILVGYLTQGYINTNKFKIRTSTNDLYSITPIIFSNLAMALGFRIIWQIITEYIPLVSGFESGASIIVCLIIFTVFGITMVFNKKLKSDFIPYEIWGYILIGFVLLRLILVDIWTWNTILRVIAFACVGLILLFTAFLKNRKNN